MTKVILIVVTSVMLTCTWHNRQLGGVAALYAIDFMFKVAFCIDELGTPYDMAL